MTNRLIEILEIQSESYNQFRMFSRIIRKLKKINCTYYVNDGNIYVTKGITENYPCIVSHMDTVHNITDDLTAIEINGNITGFNSVTMQQTGIGGDDKVGIYIALECLYKFDNIKAVFFRDEEVGCEGSYNANFDFFNDCNFVLQCDRKGNKDFVINASNIPLSSKEFQKDIRYILNDYGYDFCNGMMTDVMALKENGIVCSMANISCGYYNPHCSNEYVNIKDTMNCKELVFTIISDIGGNYYPLKIGKVKKEKYKKDYFINDSYFEDKQFYDTAYCDCCGEYGKLKYVSNYNMDMCNGCVKQYMEELSIPF